MRMGKMTSRERLLSVINHNVPDKTVWAPNLAYWWDFHQEVRELGEVNFLESIGADALIRGHYPIEPGGVWEDLLLFTDETPHCSVQEVFHDPNRKEIRYITPLGELTAEYTYLTDAKTWFLTKHPVQTQEEFEILRCYKEDIVIRPSYEKYHRKRMEYGQRCLMIPLLTMDMKTAFQSLVEYWVGLEDLIYALADFPETVEQVLQTMQRVNEEYVTVSAGAKAEIYISWEDSSTTLVSPALYEKYIAPEINRWCHILHSQGSRYMQHACGTLKNLALVMKQTGIDVLESLTPPPTGDIEMWQMAEILGPGVVLIGGIEPTRFADLRGAEFAAYIADTLERMKGKAFVLSNSDSCPPEVPMENFAMVAKIVQEG